MVNQTRVSLLGRVQETTAGQSWSEFSEMYDGLIQGWLYRQGVQSQDADDIRQEVMTKMVPPRCRIVVSPLQVVNRHSHFSRVSMIQTIGAAKVLVAPIVLRVRDVGVVIKPVHVLGVLLAPSCAVGLLLSVGSFRLAGHCERTNANRNGK